MEETNCNSLKITRRRLKIFCAAFFERLTNLSSESEKIRKDGHSKQKMKPEQAIFCCCYHFKEKKFFF